MEFGDLIEVSKPLCGRWIVEGQKWRQGDQLGGYYI